MLGRLKTSMLDMLDSAKVKEALEKNSSERSWNEVAAVAIAGVAQLYILLCLYWENWGSISQLSEGQHQGGAEDFRSIRRKFCS